MLTELLRNRRTSFPKSTKWRRENPLEYSKLAKQVNTISQIFPKTGRISGPEVGDGAKPDVPTTDRQYGEKRARNFQKFSSDDCNESLQSSPPSLTGFNIQASVTKIVTSESRESPQ